jgi:hypothetical protein
MSRKTHLELFDLCLRDHPVSILHYLTVTACSETYFGQPLSRQVIIHQLRLASSPERAHLDLEQVLSRSLGNAEDGTDTAVLEFENILHVDTVLLQLVDGLYVKSISSAQMTSLMRLSCSYLERDQHLLGSSE